MSKEGKKTIMVTLIRVCTGNMANLWLHLVFSVVAFFTSAASGACSSVSFSSNRVYATCSDLPHLSSSLHWSYDIATSSLSLAFVAPPPKPEGWVAWAINPKANGMLGAQALIASRQSDGSMAVRTYNITSYNSIVVSPIGFETTDLAAEYSDGVMRIFGRIKLPAGSREVKQVWQVGPSVAKGIPQVHEFRADNLLSRGSLNLVQGTIALSMGSNTLKRNIHGILNVVSWGILFPIGTIFARYLRSFECSLAVWFYLHVTCQLISYGVGVSGWAIGLSLGSESKKISDTTHRNIGFALFSLATLQAFALIVRPPNGHQYRLYWSVYHQFVGYTIIVLSIVNIYRGLAILNIDKKWTVAYDIALCILGGIALCLEFVARSNALRRNSENSTEA